MSPLEIEILLHYYSREGDYRGGDFSAPAVYEGIRKFSTVMRFLSGPNCGALSSYELTERGAVFVKALLHTPLPVQKWVMP